MQRITGIVGLYAVVLTPEVARQIANDHAALRGRTAGEVRAAKPGPDVLALIAALPDDAPTRLAEHPDVVQGAVPTHPFNVMVGDSTLQAQGKIVTSAFLGTARLIPAQDLGPLEALHGWRRDQDQAMRACGLG